MARKIATEERKLLVAERKLTSIRLLTELFKRAQAYPSPTRHGRRAGGEDWPLQQKRKAAAVASVESELEALIRAERVEKERSRAEEAERRQRYTQLLTSTQAILIPFCEAAQTARRNAQVSNDERGSLIHFTRCV